MKIPHEHHFVRASGVKVYPEKPRKQRGYGANSGKVVEYRQHVCLICGAENWRPV